MPTELHVRVYPNPYRGYEARFVWNGMLHRYSFELQTELACMLVDDSVEQAVIDEVMDSLDTLEWSEPEYPLGVSYVGEAACDCCCGPVECTVTIEGESANPPSSVGSNMEPATFIEYFKAVFWMGAVAAPIVGIVFLGRFAWFKAAEWGWM